MGYKNQELASVLQDLDLGNSVAESDNRLETARIETSTFSDLLSDRVDLIPGTKGSGKSALFRIFVDFMPQVLLQHNKVVVAHGVQSAGDAVFHVFKDEFSGLSEEEFVGFWCVYLVSLAHEQFLKGDKYAKYFQGLDEDIKEFRQCCEKARIPEIKAQKDLKSILEWGLHVVKHWRPKVSYSSPDIGGKIELDLFDNKMPGYKGKPAEDNNPKLPIYVNELKGVLERILGKCDLSLWLMVDRLDEIFPRRSTVEKNALRGLLRAMNYFKSSSIRVKVFLRDDMLEQVVSGDEGFTALTHVTARQADTLRWTQDQIETLIVKRMVANSQLVDFFDINVSKVDASAAYRKKCFNLIFPPTVYRGTRQSSTIRWIYNRCSDGRGVVTPRDILDLLIRARQRQHNICSENPDGESEWLIDSQAIIYGHEELSKRKRDTYLQAEFPHLWGDMQKFVGGKTEYNEAALRKLFKGKWQEKIDDLLSIGFLSEGKKKGQPVYSIPFLYRHGLELTQGSA